jgi:hypothetical protein
MANTTINSGNVVTQYDKKLFREYVRGNGFAGFTSTSPMSPITIKEFQGNQIASIPLVTKLT